MDQFKEITKKYMMRNEKKGYNWGACMVELVEHLCIFVFDFWSQIVSNMTIVLNFIFHNQWNIGWHRQLHLGWQWCCFCEWIQIAACKCQCNWLLHFNDDSLFFLVNWACLCQFYIGCTNITTSGEFNTLKKRKRKTNK